MTHREGLRSSAPVRVGLCGCWNAINPPHCQDLRDDATHGTVGHGRHGRLIHAWCELCSPGSVAVFDAILERLGADVRPTH